MLTLLFFAFLSGVVTILAPCIWPLLPLLLSASASTGRRRPAGIVLGIITSFTVFTLFLTYLLQFIPINANAFRTVAAVLIILLGLTLLVPSLNRILESYISRLSGKFGLMAGKNREGFLGGYMTGFFLGVLWSPCAGPILAAVATLAATRAVSLEAFAVTLAFGVGIGIPLFIIATLGQKFFTKSRALSPYTGRIQQAFGVVMILAALAILTNFDKTIQTKILDTFPRYGSFLVSLEDNDSVRKQLDALRQNKPTAFSTDKSDLKDLGAAPEFQKIAQWLNTDAPLTMKDLRGKVVLIDFWTYSCINCIRTLPFVTGWYEKYKDDGFVVVGVHTPEFAFERETKNVENAIGRYRITYPVAQDNEYGTWQAFSNRYWPAHYLIDAEGNIRFVHFGEGKYDETEEAIQELLGEAGMIRKKDSLLTEKDETPHNARTPETYLGSARQEHFASPETFIDGAESAFTFPKKLPLNAIALSGRWTIEKERALSGEGAALRIAFRGQKVFLVLSPPDTGSAQVRVLLDGRIISSSEAGADAPSGGAVISEDRLYELISLPENGDHTLELQFLTPDTAAYAFTFG